MITVTGIPISLFLRLMELLKNKSKARKTLPPAPPNEFLKEGNEKRTDVSVG